MKRIVSFVLALATALAFAGCNKQEDGITITEFEELLNKQPMTVFSTQYLVQDNKDKEAYPDLLEAVVKNNTTQTVTSVEIAYVAWNLKKQPVQIKSATDNIGTFDGTNPDIRFSLPGDRGDTSLDPVDYRRSIDPLFDFFMEYSVCQFA